VCNTLLLEGVYFLNSSHFRTPVIPFSSCRFYERTICCICAVQISCQRFQRLFDSKRRRRRRCVDASHREELKKRRERPQRVGRGWRWGWRRGIESILGFTFLVTSARLPSLSLFLASWKSSVLCTLVQSFIFVWFCLFLSFAYPVPRYLILTPPLSPSSCPVHRNSWRLAPPEATNNLGGWRQLPRALLKNCKN